MCLAVPLKIIKIEKKFAVARVGSLKRQINIEMLDNLKVGDYCLVHAGFAIQKVDIKAAKEMQDILSQIPNARKPKK
jgi:hydrogenase expression/formation protein HypC